MLSIGKHGWQSHESCPHEVRNVHKWRQTSDPFSINSPSNWLARGKTAWVGFPATPPANNPNSSQLSNYPYWTESLHEYGIWISFFISSTRRIDVRSHKDSSSRIKRKKQDWSAIWLAQLVKNSASMRDRNSITLWSVLNWVWGLGILQNCKHQFFGKLLWKQWLWHVKATL